MVLTSAPLRPKCAETLRGEVRRWSAVHGVTRSPRCDSLASATGSGENPRSPNNQASARSVIALPAVTAAKPAASPDAAHSRSALPPAIVTA